MDEHGGKNGSIDYKIAICMSDRGGNQTKGAKEKLLPFKIDGLIKINNKINNYYYIIGIIKYLPESLFE